MRLHHEDRVLRATVSGSFRRALDHVRHAVSELQANGVDVLSPTDPTRVDAFCDFVYVASDVLRVVRLLQQRHFAAIERSDLLWVCVPDGTLGPSTTAEIHHANMFGVPVFSYDVPNDIYWRQSVVPCNSLSAALEIVRNDATRPETAESPSPSFLLDPEDAAQSVIASAESLLGHLTTRGEPSADDPRVWHLLRQVREVSSPTRRGTFRR